MNKFYLGLLCASVLSLVSVSPLPARLMESMSYSELFEKADLVVIASAISTADTAEKTSIAGFPVVGMSTEFKVQLAMKGNGELKQFTLHHYRLANPREPVVNGPELISFNPTEHDTFLLFLVKEQDGRYSPASGQVDPRAFAVMTLEHLRQR